jgi:hypothetical protein
MAGKFTLRKLKTILLLVFGTPALLCVGGAVISETFWGDATVAIVAPLDQGLHVEVIGQVNFDLEPGEHRVWEMPQGQQVLTATPTGGNPVQTELDLGSGFDGFMVLLPDQCFAQVDVTDWYYEGNNDEPHIEETFEGGQVIEYPWASAGFDEDGLPYSINEHGAAYLFVQMPCEMVDMPEQHLMTVLFE